MHEVEEDRLKSMMYNLITEFAEGVEGISDIDELDEAWEAFVDFHSLDEDMADLLFDVVVEAAMDNEINEDEDEDSPVQKLLSFLRSLKKMPSPSEPFFKYSLSDKADPYGNVRGNQTSTAKYLGRNHIGDDTPSNSLRISRKPVMSEETINEAKLFPELDNSPASHHKRMVHAVTRFDRKQEERSEKTGSYHNHYALGQYIIAADRAHKDMKKGASPAEAINNHFNGSLARHLHKNLGTGGTDVDSQRKKSFGENVRLPATKLEEGLQQPLNPAYLKAAQRFTSMHGETLKGEYTANPAKELRETMKLVDERKKLFNEDEGKGDLNMPSFIDRKR